MRIITLSIILLIGFTACSQSPKAYNKKLVYSCDFDDPSTLQNWVMEGPGVAKIENGKLLLFSEYFEVANSYLSKNEEIFTGAKGDFYSAVEPAMRKEIGDSIDAYYVDGVFRGGHFVYWNKFKTPDNYIIECDFQSFSENALHMLMFSCSGENGEDVFAPHLKKRFGVAAQYTKSDLYNYRISFFAPGRGTTNMRKCPGRILTVKGEDLTLKNKMDNHQLKIVKYKETIEWYIDGELSFQFKDHSKDGYLKGGQTAIRLMVPAKGLYDNYRIWEIEE